VQALVASCAPGAAHAVGEIATRTQVPAVAPCNDDPRIGVRYPYLWPVGLPANAEAAALADFAVARGYDSAAIVGGHAIARYAREALRDRKIPMGDSGAVTIAAAPAEAVLATPQRPLLGTHLLDTAAFASQPAAEGVVFTTYGFPDPGSAAAEFYAAFERRYGRRPSASAVALGYDAVRVLAAAIEAARSLDAGDIVNQLASGLFVDGALGRISYPGGGEHNPEVAVAVVRVETGRRVLVEKSLPEDVPSP
jgi:ABC-type branched-subunit amino acid transport system substrate-binding protein